MHTKSTLTAGILQPVVTDAETLGLKLIHPVKRPVPSLVVHADMMSLAHKAAIYTMYLFFNIFINLLIYFMHITARQCYFHM